MWTVFGDDFTQGNYYPMVPSDGFNHVNVGYSQNSIFYHYERAFIGFQNLLNRKTWIDPYTGTLASGQVGANGGLTFDYYGSVNFDMGPGGSYTFDAKGVYVLAQITAKLNTIPTRNDSIDFLSYQNSGYFGVGIGFNLSATSVYAKLSGQISSTNLIPVVAGDIIQCVYSSLDNSVSLYLNGVLKDHFIVHSVPIFINRTVTTWRIQWYYDGTNVISSFIAYNVAVGYNKMPVPQFNLNWSRQPRVPLQNNLFPIKSRMK